MTVPRGSLEPFFADGFVVDGRPPTTPLDRPAPVVGPLLVRGAAEPAGRGVPPVTARPIGDDDLGPDPVPLTADWPVEVARPIWFMGPRAVARPAPSFVKPDPPARP